MVDAEWLLSYYTAKFLQQKGHENEYQYVKVIAQWHVSSDRRRINTAAETLQLGNVELRAGWVVAWTIGTL